MKLNREFIQAMVAQGLPLDAEEPLSVALTLMWNIPYTQETLQDMHNQLVDAGAARPATISLAEPTDD